MSEEIKTNEQSNAGQTIIVNQQEKKQMVLEQQVSYLL